MKYFLIGTVLDTKDYGSVQGMQEFLQKRLDNWLGKDETKIQLVQLGSHAMRFTLYRDYGIWFEDPQRFRPQTSVFSYDKQILLGLDYQYGTYADLKTLAGRYVISYHEDDFFQDYKEKAKENHCTRIKHLEQQSFLDRIEFTVELVQPKRKQHP